MASNYPLKLHSPINRLQFDIADGSEDHLIASLRTHPDVRRHLPMFPLTMTVEEAASLRRYRAANPTYCDYHLHIVEEGIRKFVGMIGFRNLDEDNGSVEMGILLFPDFHGKGFGTETLYVLLCYLFEERRMHRVSFQTSVDNAQMRGWFDDVAGVTLEGISRELWRSVEDRNSYVDVAIYCILEQEWRDAVKKRLNQRLCKK
ncbi:acyl-CoA N-acyltransferase [Hymenopellis radicata]|nr:acyl-CoA N-acyltransferase [Hymenopellis radicata]